MPLSTFLGPSYADLKIYKCGLADQQEKARNNNPYQYNYAARVVNFLLLHFERTSYPSNPGLFVWPTLKSSLIFLPGIIFTLKSQKGSYCCHNYAASERARRHNSCTRSYSEMSFLVDSTPLFYTAVPCVP